MSRSYTFRFVNPGSGDVVDLVGHGNVRRSAERSARRRLRRQGKDPKLYQVRSCETDWDRTTLAVEAANRVRNGESSDHDNNSYLTRCVGPDTSPGERSTARKARPLVEQLRQACSVAFGDLIAHGMHPSVSTGELLRAAITAAEAYLGQTAASSEPTKTSRESQGLLRMKGKTRAAQLSQEIDEVLLMRQKKAAAARGSEYAMAPEIDLWTRRELARAAWAMTGTEMSEFEIWYQTCAKAVTCDTWECPPLILAMAAWNGGRGRDSLAVFSPEDGNAFEQWVWRTPLPPDRLDGA